MHIVEVYEVDGRYFRDKANAVAYVQNNLGYKIENLLMRELLNVGLERQQRFDVIECIELNKDKLLELLQHNAAMLADIDDDQGE